MSEHQNEIDSSFLDELLASIKYPYQSRQKNYSDNLNEIDKDELFEGLLGYGLFEEKIPNFLSSESFFAFCKRQESSFFTDYNKPAKFIKYDSMRNINIPREIAIPNPMAYRNLCHILSENWGKLQEYFRKSTKNHTHKISRIHIRKIEDQKNIFERCYEGIESIDVDILESNEQNEVEDTAPSSSEQIIKDHLFEISHKNFCADDYPEPLLLIEAKYLVNADISNCFPSIYTHSIPWALVTKEMSKEQRDNELWFNAIDLKTRNLKDAETHGILIGPHASNLISEIILVKVDEVLYDKGYRYIRHIDDYSCYVKSREEADRFLIDLSTELKKYSLTLNHKKTEIKELPLVSSEHWIRRLKRFVFVDKDGKVGLNEVRSFMDIALDLMSQNKNNSAVMNYAIRLLSKKDMTERAQDYFIKTIHHLVLVYPYLIQLLDKEVFEIFKIDKREIQSMAKNIYQMGQRNKFYESMSYALFFCLKNNFEISSAALYDEAEQSSDSVFMLLAYLYDKKFHSTPVNMEKYKKLANSLNNDDEMDHYWLFVYEVLPARSFKKYWEKMKEESVTFIDIPDSKYGF
ncbi:MAG: RNA-directed DNA polymerase [Sulfurovum sp.]|nr:RNA-directed DNA polymerase [Sulfurovum sp.]